MAYSVIAVNSRRATEVGGTGARRRGDSVFAALMARLNAVNAGTVQAESWHTANDKTANEYLHRAAAAWITSGGSGSQSAVINGTTVSATWATSDTVSAVAMAAAINADATASKYVSAVTRIAKLTTASAVAGNTVTVCGITFTAQSSAATAGTEQWDIRTSDTAAGLSLATQINSHPALVDVCTAVNSAGVVYIGLLEDRAARSGEQVATNAATVTIANQFVQGGIIMVVAHFPGIMGNACTFTASGTGASALSLVSGKLGGGSGFDTVNEVVNSYMR